MAGLIVRDSERFEVAMPARMRVAGEHASIVRLSAAAPQRDGWVDVDVIDLSRGGFGVMSPIFFPRRSLVQVQIFQPGSESDETVLEGIVRVMRVTMTDARPGYLLGLAQESATGLLARQLEVVIGRLSQTGFELGEESEHA
jgi:hypothetical protein